MTVSTFLRQSPIDRYSIEYDPTKKASVSEQSFREGLGDETKDQSKGISAVSTYLPNGLPVGNADSSQNRTYSRQATETQYGVTKTQTSEYIRPGVVEDISIAVTLDKNNLPSDTTIEELKDLIAKAASPKVTAANVSIAYTTGSDPYLTPDRQQAMPTPDKTGNPWWLALLLTGFGLVIIFSAISSEVRRIDEENAIEVENLRQRTMEQEKQLNAINSKASQLTQRQSQLAQDLINQQNMQRAAAPIPHFDENLLIDSLDSISGEITEDSADKIKSWIEEGSGREG